MSVCRVCGEDIIPPTNHWHLLTREQSAVELQMERCADLKGQLGILRAAMRDALDQSVPGTSCHAILKNALEPKP